MEKGIPTFFVCLYTFCSLCWEGISQHQTCIHGHHHLVVHLKVEWFDCSPKKLNFIIALITTKTTTIILDTIIFAFNKLNIIIDHLIHLTNVFWKSVDWCSDFPSHVYSIFGVRETVLESIRDCHYHWHQFSSSSLSLGPAGRRHHHCHHHHRHHHYHQNAPSGRRGRR